MPANKRSWAEVQRLWEEGYLLYQIARMTRISRSSIDYHVALGRLKLPERPWVEPFEVGIEARKASKWVKRGLLQRSPGGLYNRFELQRVASELASRTCAYPGCENPVPGINPRQVFCAVHANQGLGYDSRALDAIRKYSGISLTHLYSLCRLPREQVRPLLEKWERQGIIRVERTPRGGSRYFIADEQQQSA